MKSQRENANKLEVTVFHNLIIQVTLYDFSIHFKQVHCQDAAHSQEERITQGSNYHFSVLEFSRAGCLILSHEGVPHRANLK